MVQRQRNATPEVEIKSNRLPVYQRDKPYKYLGKSMSIVGEDAKQITDVVDTYKDLVTKIKASDLPLALKGSAMNNLALAKILHHFYNSRLSVKQLDQLDNIITDAVREFLFFFFYSSKRINNKFYILLYLSNYSTTPQERYQGERKTMTTPWPKHKDKQR